MRSVGIKALKNKLSSYLALVKQGEIILVTDRDVVAELRRPSRQMSTDIPPFESYLYEAVAQGVLTSAVSIDPLRNIKLPKSGVIADMSALLTELLEDR